MESKILEILEIHGPKFPDYRTDTKGAAKELSQLMCDREVTIIYGAHMASLYQAKREVDFKIVKLSIFNAFRNLGEFTEDQIQLSIDKLIAE